MNQLSVSIKKLQEDVVLPSYQSLDAAGADIHAYIKESLTIAAHTTVKIPTGFAIAIPQGYAGFIYARSSLGTKQGLAPANKVGVIDSDYRGEVMVCLHNHSDLPQHIEPNQRIAQLIIAPCYQAKFNVVDDLENTQRGSGGFGSTGK
ncbi:MAG: dUTP diphosphatase [Erysipelotrichaceae bacterium]|nr:dUTP diphosphatase [Erysipelotrichaceae bacterium]